MRVVLLRDGRWPVVPGVCCWRHGVRTAFAATGATVTETTWGRPGALVAQPTARVASTPRLARLTPRLRRPLVSAYRGGRAAARRVNRAIELRRVRGAEPPPALAGAALVVADSPDAGEYALACGVPRARIWALVLPVERIGLSAPGGEVARAAARLGGLLTDSEAARDTIERAAATCRPRVEIFPPIAADVPCPDCAGVTVSTMDDSVLPAPVAQLWRWRSGDATAADPPYSYPASRRRGLGGQWEPAPRSDWAGGAAAVPLTPVPGDGPEPWTCAAQRGAARAVCAAVLPSLPPHAATRPARTALLAGFDLKFAVELAERLDVRADVDMVVDDWPALSRPTRWTERRLRRADVVFAEWARTSAVRLARRKRPGQFLVVRLHRFELDTAYPRHLPVDAVDAMVYIAPLFGRRIRDELGWPASKLVYIPNLVDLDALARPKEPHARFTLGLVGIEWIRKRFDLALDLLAAVREEDPRFTLRVRTAMPWDNEYAWARPEEREYVGWCLDRVERDPRLHGAVTIDPPGRDMARWFRHVGHLLSTSDEEGSHTAVAEGMGSGAVPVMRPWPGATELYDKEWTHQSVAEAAAAVLADADPDVWADRAARAVAEIRRSHNPDLVVAAWADLLHGDVDRARTYFAEYAGLEGA
jgi:glycosyltransferase involved in cell wall biosynthesis